MDEQRIREIVREELAAQDNKQPANREVYLSKEHEKLCRIGISTPL